VAVLAQPFPLRAQEVLRLPDAERVPVHSSVDVSTLPAPPVGGLEGAQIKVQPRYLRDPEGLRRLKELLRQATPEALPTPETFEDPAPLVTSLPLSVVTSFEGVANLPDNVPLTGFTVVPSDANLAVGPNHVFEMVNIVGRITNKSGGAASTFPLRSFFQLDLSTESDPRVIYDAGSGRWYATYLQSSTTPTQSSVVLAVSTTSDPTGTFCLVRLGNPTTETFLQDFPQIGISDDKVVVTYNAFNLVGPGFLGAGYYVINKSDLTSGACPASIQRVRVPPNLARYGIQPAQSLSSTGTLYMGMNDGTVPGGSAVRVFRVNGVPGAGAVMEESSVVNVRSWLFPPDAPQPGSSVLLATNDESVISAVWRDGSLWIGGNERCLPSGDSVLRSCLRAIQIQTDVPTVQQDITFGSHGQYYYYPAIGPDGAGNLVVVFNASSATEFAGVRVTGRLTTDPVNTFVPSILLRAGGGAQTGSGRMGDYYGAALDPADPSKVWVTAEYIRTTAERNWGTFIAQLTFLPPTLALSLNHDSFKAGDTLEVSLTVGNPGGPVVVDLYIGAALPAAAGPALGCPLGDAIAFAVAGSPSAVIRCRSASPATFPVFSRTSIPAGQPPTTTPFFSFVWPSAPVGSYTVFAAFVVPDSLADGSLGPTDIIVIDTQTLTFSL